MRIFHLTTSLIAALTLYFAGGCYWDRLTWQYGDTEELDGQAQAVIEESGVSAEDLKKRDDFLKKLETDVIKPYTINAGDSLAITVYNHEDLSTRTVVTPDGFLGMVLVGQIKVSGLTLEQAGKVIEKALSKYIRTPKVGVSPTIISSETVTISGAVNKSGMFNISNGMRLADLFALAGGSSARLYDGQTLDAADLEKSVFVRDNKIVPIDFNVAIKQGIRPHNMLLHKGDYVYIAAKDDSMVYTIGDMGKSKRHTYHDNMTLLEIISSSGGMNETHWSHVIIIRGSLSNPKMYKVDLDGILCGKKHNVRLHAGDIVYLPHDTISEYNVFIRKLFPTAQLVNLITTPMFWYTRF